MPRAILLLLLACWFGPAQNVRTDSLSNALATVEDLYRNAQFREAGDRLKEIEKQLPSAPSSLEDLKKLRLYQALVDVATNESEDAKAKFLELLALEPGFSLAREEHAPKVIAIFDEARKQYTDTECKTVCTKCEAASSSGDLQSAVNIIKTYRLQCECARQLSSTLALRLVEGGTSAFRLQDYSRALSQFKAALEAEPGNQVAVEYSIRAATQLEKAITDTFIDWRRYFEARDFAKAKSAYEGVVLMSADGRSSAPEQIRTEYHKLFERDKQAWAQACAREDALTTDSLRQEVRAADPSGNLNRDVLRQIQSCPAAGCTEIRSEEALSRLRSRVYPKVDTALRPASKVGVKIRIDEKGRVTVLDIDNPAGNRVVTQAVKDAVEQWKFDPAISARSESRCVVTLFLLQFDQ